MRPRAAASATVRSKIAVVAWSCAASLLAPAAAGAVDYWVGNGGSPPCTHADLQSALETAAGNATFDYVFLVGPGPFQGPFTILGSDVDVIGGAPACGSVISSGDSTLRAASGMRPLTILSGGGGTVRLRHLVIGTEGGTYSGDGGAIWFAGANPSSRLELVDTRVTGSTATAEGGGIYVSAGGLHVLDGSLVFANAASNGGGIAARNGAEVTLADASVAANTALFDGGGLYAPDALVRIEARSSNAITAVANNVAGRDGGGLYVGGAGGNVVTAARDVPPVAIAGNSAQRGGGVFVWETLLRLLYASVAQNQAAAEGGGVFVGNDGALLSSEPNELNPIVGGFPRFETNTAAEGSAVYAVDSAVILSSGRIRGHQAPAGGAATMAAERGVLFLHGLVFTQNAVPALVGVGDALSFQAEHLALSGNDLAGVVRWSGAGSEVSLSAFALDETEPLFASFPTPAVPPFVHCMVSRHASPFAGLPPGTTPGEIVIADPQFVAPPFDLHLRTTSPAIDRCGENPRPDLDGDARTSDDPYHPNPPQQTADAGADETTVLFVDGFESGDRGQWSGGSP